MGVESPPGDRQGVPSAFTMWHVHGMTQPGSATPRGSIANACECLECLRESLPPALSVDASVLKDLLFGPLPILSFAHPPSLLLFISKFSLFSHAFPSRGVTLPNSPRLRSTIAPVRDNQPADQQLSWWTSVAPIECRIYRLRTC